MTNENGNMTLEEGMRTLLKQAAQKNREEALKEAHDNHQHKVVPPIFPLLTVAPQGWPQFFAGFDMRDNSFVLMYGDPLKQIEPRRYTITEGMISMLCSMLAPTGQEEP